MYMTLLTFAQAEGKVVKLNKLIQLDEESLSRPDGFLNRHAKIKARLEKQYAQLREAEEVLRSV